MFFPDVLEHQKTNRHHYMNHCAASNNSELILIPLLIHYTIIFHAKPCCTVPETMITIYYNIENLYHNWRSPFWNHQLFLQYVIDYTSMIQQTKTIYDCRTAAVLPSASSSKLPHHHFFHPWNSTNWITSVLSWLSHRKFYWTTTVTDMIPPCFSQPNKYWSRKEYPVQ